MSAGSLVATSRSLAERFVAPLGRRWAHVQAVAARAEELRSVVAATDGDILVAAAWLHDIGYSPEIGHTRFHPLDGGRYLSVNGFSERLAALVAHHSGARFEAEERGLASELSSFALEDGPVMDALVTADLTTGPDGAILTYDERMNEILSRYAEDDPVHRTWVRARQLLMPCVERTEARISQAPSA